MSRYFLGPEILRETKLQKIMGKIKIPSRSKFKFVHVHFFANILNMCIYFFFSPQDVSTIVRFNAEAFQKDNWPPDGGDAWRMARFR